MAKLVGEGHSRERSMTSIKVVHSSFPKGEVNVEGETIEEVVAAFRRNDLHRNCDHTIIRLNGALIPKTAWATTAVQNGDTVRLSGGEVHYLSEETFRTHL